MKVALVTGAATRIGKSVAISLANAGWAVAVHFCSSEVSANKTVEEIISNGGLAKSFSADFKNESAVKELISVVGDSLGTVTCLINNASIFENDSLRTSTRETWDAHMEVNLRAPFVLSQALVDNISEKKSANIINILDQRVLNLTPYFTSYTISKSALWTLTRTLASALSPHIRGNAIGPGPTLPSKRQSDEEFKKQFNALPLERSVTLSEICAAVQFIIDCQSMTGQLITIDAGQHLGWAQPSQKIVDTE